MTQEGLETFSGNCLCPGTRCDSMKYFSIQTAMMMTTIREHRQSILELLAAVVGLASGVSAFSILVAFLEK